MQVNQLSDLLHNSKCKAHKYRSHFCPYYKLNTEIVNYHKKNKTLPPNFCRELLDFKITCKHHEQLDKSICIAAQFIFLNDDDYNKLPERSDDILKSQLQRSEFNGFPLQIFSRKLLNMVSEYFIDNCLEKIKVPIDELFKAVDTHISKHEYNLTYGINIQKMEKIIDIMLKKVDLLDKEKYIDVLYLVCKRFNVWEKIFEKMISVGFIPNEKCLEIVLTKGHTKAVKRLLTFNIPITSYHLKFAKNLEDVKLLFKSGYIPTQDDLMNACLRSDHDLIRIILAYKIPISKEHFRSVIDSPNKRNDTIENEEGERTYVIPNSKYDKKTFNGLVEELIYNGYYLDNEDIVYALRHHVEIESLGRFNILPDKSLFDVCKSSIFLPTYTFTGVTDEEVALLRIKIELINLFNGDTYDRPTMSKVKKIIGKHKIVIDNDIMDCVFKHTKMCKIAEYLMSLGGVITDACMDQMIKNGCTNDHQLIATKYKKRMTDKVNTLENKVKALEKELELLKI